MPLSCILGAVLHQFGPGDPHNSAGENGARAPSQYKDRVYDSQYKDKTVARSPYPYIRKFYTDKTTFYIEMAPRWLVARNVGFPITLHLEINSQLTTRFLWCGLKLMTNTSQDRKPDMSNTC